jgi:hypothetical protein
MKLEDLKKANALNDELQRAKYELEEFQSDKVKVVVYVKDIKQTTIDPKSNEHKYAPMANNFIIDLINYLKAKISRIEKQIEAL